MLTHPILLFTVFADFNITTLVDTIWTHNVVADLTCADVMSEKYDFVAMVAPDVCVFGHFFGVAAF
jgi:hypothetical protein